MASCFRSQNEVRIDDIRVMREVTRDKEARHDIKTYHFTTAPMTEPAHRRTIGAPIGAVGSGDPRTHVDDPRRAYDRAYAAPIADNPIDADRNQLTANELRADSEQRAPNAPNESGRGNLGAEQPPEMAADHDLQKCSGPIGALGAKSASSVQIAPDPDVDGSAEDGTDGPRNSSPDPVSMSQPPSRRPNGTNGRFSSNPKTCVHEFVDTPLEDGRVRTVCRHCGKFRGYRSEKRKQRK